MLPGLLMSAWNWVTSATSNTDSDNIAEPSAARRTVTRPSVTPQQPHRSCIIVHIYARTKESIDAVISDIEKVISEYLMDKVLDQPEDQQYIAKLTDQQVMLSCLACFTKDLSPVLCAVADRK